MKANWITVKDFHRKGRKRKGKKRGKQRKLRLLKILTTGSRQIYDPDFIITMYMFSKMSNYKQGSIQNVCCLNKNKILNKTFTIVSNNKIREKF